MKNYAKMLENYKILNKSAQKNATVFFGADWLSEIPVAELAHDNGMDTAVYNRSLKGLRIEEAEQVLDECIYGLNPDKVFINIGENDIKSFDFDIDVFSEKYEWLLYDIHSKCGCAIYILSVTSDRGNSVNHILEKISEKYGCKYIDIQKYKVSFFSFFSAIRMFIRKGQITFCEAFRI